MSKAQTLIWNDANAIKPDADLTVACWGPDGFFSGFWGNRSPRFATPAWIDGATGKRAEGVTHWADVTGPDEITTPQASDAIQIGGNHYTSKAVQPWAAMQAWMTPEQFAGFLRGNAIKYLARCNDKGGLEDLKKARHYLDKLIEQGGRHE